MSDECFIDISRNMNSDTKSRKALRQAVFAGIVRQHRKTLFALGSFLKLYRQSQVNTYGAIE
jgi:hypothetical protein